jgi:hypothetical protein
MFFYLQDNTFPGQKVVGHGINQSLECAKSVDQCPRSKYFSVVRSFEINKYVHSPRTLRTPDGKKIFFLLILT